jgi:predicted RNA-binding protein with PIN domain
MLSYKDVEFTDDLIKEISATVGRAEDDDVLKYVRVHKDLSKGFQIKKNSCATFRKKIDRHIVSMHEMDIVTANFLYNSGVGREFVTVLSCFALEYHLYEFAAIFGQTAFTLALLLDERDEIRELGCQLLENSETRNIDTDSARKIVADNMQSFATHFSRICIATPVTPTPTGAQDDQIAELKRQLKAEQKLKNDLSSLLQEEKRSASRQLSEKAERIEKLSSERNELRSSCTAYQDQTESLRSELEQNRLTYDTNVAATVESRLEGLTNSWLRKRIQLEQKLQHKVESTELLAQAEEAIVRQTQADRHTGNRRELQLRLSAISSKLAEVRDVRANALHPIEDLLEIENRLVVEEQNILRLIGTQKSPLVQALAARINSVSESDNSHHLELFLDQLHELCLSDSDFYFLQNQLGERYDRLLSVAGDRPLLPLPINPALKFRFALAQGEPLTLVCDGHNIINSLEMFRDVRNRNHAAARKSLSDSIADLMQPYQGSTATIVYDGPDHNKVECSDNVTVIYSGGGKNEMHRADRRIEEMLNWRQYTDRSVPVFVVTADYDLGKEARESGAEVIPLEHFEWFMGEKSCS